MIIGGGKAMKAISIYALCAPGITLLGWAGTNHAHTSYYREKCGMRRGRDQRAWFGVPYQDSNRFFGTGYSELYLRVMPNCRHKWTFTGSRTSGDILHGGEIGCGRFPYGLRYAPLLRRLHNLDKTKTLAVLKSLPLQPVTAQPTRDRMDNIIESLIDLSEDPTPAETEAWWQKNRKFLG